MTVREGLPRVSYATALDMYLNVCVIYEMAAMIEYAAVNYFTKIMPLEGGKDEDEDQVCVHFSSPEPKVHKVSIARLWRPSSSVVHTFEQIYLRGQLANCLIELRFNGTSALVGHFVSSLRERENRDRIDSRGDGREGQGKRENE